MELRMILRWCGVMTLALTCTAATKPEPDPAWYVKKDTWLETMAASAEALARLEAKRTPQLKVSDVVRGGQPARSFNVDITTWNELYLYVVGAPDVVYGAATWAYPVLVRNDGTRSRLGTIKGLKVIEGQLSIDVNLMSGVSGPLKIAGTVYDHGVHVYPNQVSKVFVPLAGKTEELECQIGIDDWVGGKGAVRFIAADTSGAARMDLWQLVARDFADSKSRREQKWALNDWLMARWILDGEQVARTRGFNMAKPAEMPTTDFREKELDEVVARAKTLNPRSLSDAIEDLALSYPAQYARGAEFLERLSKIESAILHAQDAGDPRSKEHKIAIEAAMNQYDALQREALLANPLLNFEQMLVVKRKPDGDPRMPIGTGYGLGEYIGLPRQTSKHDPDIDRYFGWDNEIATVSLKSGEVKTVYRPEKPKLINDLSLHWDAGRMLFSMPGTHDKWHVFEASVDGKSVKQLSPGDQPDVHYYDATYLHSGKIAFLSTACFQGVPCNAGVIVGMMYTMNGDGSSIRQICFEQDHDYCPTVTNDGRIMYMRWDYTDTPHVWNRMLFTCNPDGTNQMENYGANSYWPNAIFYARPIPNDPTKVVGIVTGHHVGRVGELVLFDPGKSHFEADGVVQRIPGRGQKVEPLIRDKLTEHSWPKFLHPYPLSDKYFIVTCKPTPDSLWGIYLVDTFDNMVLLKEIEGQALLYPIPVRQTKTPPVIPEKVVPEATDALVYLQDAYLGAPMAGVPRGTVKKLRVVAYHFAYQRIAGIDHRVGANGPWEVKRVLGTVDVEADGSAYFRVPAKTPFTVQPLDAEGKAVQLMRSWMTAMPGETVSCAGCHDNRLSAPPVKQTSAMMRGPQAIKPWFGPPRGFSFKREVQPVVDKYCVSCHNGAAQPDGTKPVDLRGEQGFFYCYKGEPKGEIIRGVPHEQLLGKYGGIFEPSYLELRRYVRVPGLESDLHGLPPMEVHADTSELFRMLKKGHHGVTLDAEAIERLATWIDLNAPCHGTWKELTKIGAKQCDRRKELQKLYGGLVQDPEDILETTPAPAAPGDARPQLALVTDTPNPYVGRGPIPTGIVIPPEGWPFDVAEALRRQNALDKPQESLDLGNGVKLALAQIPAGEFVMGDAKGSADERPQAAKIDRPFWMGQYEITNEQYAQFDPKHDSRFEHRTSWIFSEEYIGWLLNGPKQPVVRVSWQEATEYCKWLSAKTGRHFTLPTEQQWEWACRAGTDTPFSFGDMSTDFAPFANLADKSIRELAYQGWRPKAPDIAARDDRFNDGHLVTADVGSFKPNTWGLYDMHGNAAEWTASAYTGDQRVVRGGSWFDLPVRARSAARWGYEPWQKVFNVGFRVVCDDAPMQNAK